MKSVRDRLAKVCWADADQEILSWPDYKIGFDEGFEAAVNHLSACEFDENAAQMKAGMETPTALDSYGIGRNVFNYGVRMARWQFEQMRLKIASQRESGEKK
jgi:hypothetical protein